jgi:sulfate-transporting ATPase
VLKVEGLNVTFGGVTALDDFSIEVGPGEIVGLIGPNGAGKTTAIDAIAGFVRSHGLVTLKGDRIDGLRPSSRAAKGLGRSFQSIELFSDLTIAENLSVAYSPWRARQLGRDLVLPRARDVADSSAAAEAIRDFDIEETLGKHPDELPFAQRRLVGIAQAVSRSPSILLLDEPAAGLDANEVTALCVLITSLAKNWGMGILLVEHNLDMVVSICDRLLVLDRGREIAEGAPDDMLRNIDVKRVYTGVSA